MFVKEEKDYNQFNELNKKFLKGKSIFSISFTEKIFWYHAITILNVHLI